jgi:hypothetical protein
MQKYGGMDEATIQTLVKKLISSGSKVDFKLGMAVGWINEARKEAEAAGRADTMKTTIALLRIVRAKILTAELKDVPALAVLSMLSKKQG